MKDKRSGNTVSVRQKKYTFSILAKRTRETLGVEHLTTDVQKALGIMDLTGKVTLPGALLADENDSPGIGLVAADSEELYGERKRISEVSVLMQLEEAMAFFRRYWKKERVTTNLRREKVCQIPERAFYDALSGALVHRTWDTPADITVWFYPDRTEILSPGALAPGVTEKEHLANPLSGASDPLLIILFLKLGLIEVLRTGVQRIIRSYAGEFRQPAITFTENSILTVLPILGQMPQLNASEQNVLRVYHQRTCLTRVELEKETGYSRTKLSKLLRQLTEKEVLQVDGEGRSTKYRLAKGIRSDRNRLHVCQSG